MKCAICGCEYITEANFAGGKYSCPCGRTWYYPDEYTVVSVWNPDWMCKISVKVEAADD